MEVTGQVDHLKRLSKGSDWAGRPLYFEETVKWK